MLKNNIGRCGILAVMLYQLTALPMKASPISEKHRPLQKPIIEKLANQFQLKIDQIAWIKSEKIKIKFLNIVEDSRCPSDVQCVWEGQTKVMLGIARNNLSLGNFVLTSRAGHEDLAAKKFDRYSVKLIKVDPYPKANQKIEISDYVITLTITKP